MRPNLTVQRLNGRLGRRATTDNMVTGVVMNAIASGDIELNKEYTFLSLNEVEALGITADYDTTNTVLVYHRLKRLFDRNPSIQVKCMLVAQDVTLAQMADVANSYLAQLLRNNQGKIRQAFVCLNPDADYVPTIETGVDADSLATIYKLQGLADYEWSKDRYCDFFVEGRSFSGAAATLENLRELANKCPDVSVVLFADNDVSTSNARFAGYAAVEDFVGMLSLAAVSQHPGENIDQFNLIDEANGYFLNPGLSSGAHINTYDDAALDMINDKGFIIAGFEAEGVYITDTHTCTDVKSDYAFVENNRTIKQAVRLAKAALRPRVKARIYVDENTGKLAPQDAKDIERTTANAIRPMRNDGDISGGIDAYVNPDQNVLATSKLEVELTFIPVAIGRHITLKIGFTNPLN